MIKAARTLLILLVPVLLMAGCLPLLQQKTAGSSAVFAPQDLKSGDFAGAISRLTAITNDSGASLREKAEAHRRLAILHLSPRNPGRDHLKAGAELGRFLETNPEKLDRPAAADWATAIGAAEEHLNLKKEVTRLGKENRQLEKNRAELERRNAELVRETKNMEKDIEKLKNLDLSLEKKRKSFR